eukprot:9858027-Alexandrium_andersonii.AAC.1
MEGRARSANSWTTEGASCHSRLKKHAGPWCCSFRARACFIDDRDAQGRGHLWEVRSSKLQ